MTGRTGYLGALALAGALSVLAVSPALAATPNESFAALATGPIAVPPMAVADFPGHTLATLTDADITGLLTTGAVIDTADALAASATVKRPAATLTALATLTAGSVSSSCGFDTNTDSVSGSTVISSGQLELPKLTIALPVDPAPNTVVRGLGGAGSITLNAQSTASDGRLTVTAVQISLSGSPQKLSLGVSTCNTANLEPVPVLPGKTTLAALGVVALALTGTGFRLRRQRLKCPEAPSPSRRGRPDGK
jgi:hypothetical protein